MVFNQLNHELLFFVMASCTDLNQDWFFTSPWWSTMWGEPNLISVFCNLSTPRHLRGDHRPEKNVTDVLSSTFIIPDKNFCLQMHESQFQCIKLCTFDFFLSPVSFFPLKYVVPLFHHQAPTFFSAISGELVKVAWLILTATLHQEAQGMINCQSRGGRRQKTKHYPCCSNFHLKVQLHSS